MTARNKNIPALRFKGFDDEWTKKRLGDIATITTGNTPSTTVDEYYNGPRLFVSPADIQENRYIVQTRTTLTELGFKQGRKISEGSILFVCIGSTIGKIGQAAEECLTNQQINSLEGNKNTSNDFLYGLLEKYGKKIKLLAGVQAVPQINKTDFSNLKYSLPSLSEQQKIASFLSAIDEKIRQLTRKKELLEQYKKGVMQQLFSGKLRFKDEKGKAYPKWEEKRLGEVGKIITGSTPPTSNSEFYNGNNLFVSPADINSGRLIIETKTTVSDLGFKEGRSIKKGSVLFVCIGSTIGKVAQAGKQCITNQQINSIESYAENCNDYIYSLLEFNGSRIKPLAGVQAVPQINKTDFSNLKFPFPSLKEQQKIASFLSSIDTKIESITAQIERTQRYKKGLLQQMFV